MTKTDIADLTWVEFSAEDTPSCGSQREACSREAVWRGIWNWYYLEGCMSYPGPVCDVHKEKFEAQNSPSHPRHNFVHCWNHNVLTTCGEFVRFERLGK